MKRSLATIPAGTGIFIDANIFLLTAWGKGSLGQQCHEFVARVKQRDLKGYTSVSVVAEITHRLMVYEARAQFPPVTVEYLQKHPDLVRKLSRHLMIASDIARLNVDIRPVTVYDLHRAKDVRRDHGLMTNDSLIVGMMRGGKLRHLATFDNGFLPVSGIQVWAPEEKTASSPQP
ncbi:MAG: type II toxin-antitoxin system VapC family toxin [Chloroflexaceae bacterium]|nr:type II toxin-antitoxin system VapC family toxin [Chloroflexaceae bacterium]